jgi:hypothetical protein
VRFRGVLIRQREIRTAPDLAIWLGSLGRLGWLVIPAFRLDVFAASLERERRRVTDFNREDCGQDVGGHFALSSAVTISRRLRSSAIQQ